VRATEWVDDAVAGLPPLCTTAEVLGVLRISRRHLYRLVAAGRIEAVKPRARGASRLLIPRAALRGYLEGLAP